MRQQVNVTSSVISSHSMHLGVLATAWHAVNTGTMFTVYYKPRTSPSEFIVPYDQYMESLKSNHSIGMRFKMRFEGEEAPEQRFTGTIVGIGDVDSSRWSGSKWRCLKVRWDENSSVPRPERVSPWKIEPASARPLNPLPVSRPKRPRSNMIPPSPDSSVLMKEVASKVPADPPLAQGMPRVLQGQEITTLKGNIAESESDTAQKPIMWSSSHNEGKNDIAVQRRLGSENWLQMSTSCTYGNFISHAEEYDDDSFRDPNVDSKFEKMAGFLSLGLGFTLKLNAWAGLEQVPCTNNESEVATKTIKTKKGVHDLDFTKSLDKEMPDIFAPTKNPKLLC